PSGDGANCAGRGERKLLRRYHETVHDAGAVRILSDNDVLSVNSKNLRIGCARIIEDCYGASDANESVLRAGSILVPSGDVPAVGNTAHTNDRAVSDIERFKPSRVQDEAHPLDEKVVEIISYNFPCRVDPVGVRVYCLGEQEISEDSAKAGETFCRKFEEAHGACDLTIIVDGVSECCRGKPLWIIKAGEFPLSIGKCGADRNVTDYVSQIVHAVRVGCERAGKIQSAEGASAQTKTVIHTAGVAIPANDFTV